jgi:hypothetical protein
MGSRKIGRPSIGPLIDFRIPPDARSLITEWKAETGRPEDEICREVFLMGIEAAIARRYAGKR